MEIPVATGHLTDVLFIKKLNSVDVYKKICVVTFSDLQTTQIPVNFLNHLLKHRDLTGTSWTAS